LKAVPESDELKYSGRFFLAFINLVMEKQRKKIQIVRYWLAWTSVGGEIINDEAAALLVKGRHSEDRIACDVMQRIHFKLPKRC